MPTFIPAKNSPIGCAVLALDSWNYWTSQVLMCPQNPPTDGGTPQSPNRREKCPHDIQISSKHTNAQGSQQLSVGVQLKGRYPIQGWCKGSVLTHKGAPYNPPKHIREPLTTPHNMQKPLRTHRCTGVWGTYRECVHPWGCTNIWGVQMYGAYKHREHPDTR